MSTTTVDNDLVEGVMALACRAPSYHNSQPWRWIADHGELRLFLDENQVVSTDRGARQALISCGAVLDHVSAASAAYGLKANIAPFPNPNNPDHLATVDFSELTLVTEGHRRRAEAIGRRRTDRLPFDPVTDWPGFEAVLRSRIDDTVALFDVISDSDRRELVQATEITDALRLYDSSYFHDLQAWTAPYEATQGIPYSALVSAAESDRVGLGRNFPVTKNTDRREQVPYDRATILSISAHDDTRRDIMGCGQMLSTVLLEATVVGLATCTLTHLTEMSAGRHILSQITGRAYPQLLVRVGQAPATEAPPPPTPRRPVTEVLTFAL